MIRINLLPTKVSKKTFVARREMSIAGVLLAIAFLASWAVHSSMTSEIDAGRVRIAKVTQEIESLKQSAIKVEKFKAKAKTLENKINIIKSLQNRRIGPAHMLDDLATILTDQPKIWLTSLDESAGSLSLRGGAMDHENVAEFQTSLGTRSKFFEGCELNVVRTASAKEVEHVLWQMTCKTNYGAG